MTWDSLLHVFLYSPSFEHLCTRRAPLSLILFLNVFFFLSPPIVSLKVLPAISLSHLPVRQLFVSPVPVKADDCAHVCVYMYTRARVSFVSFV